MLPPYEPEPRTPLARSPLLGWLIVVVCAAAIVAIRTHDYTIRGGPGDQRLARHFEPQRSSPSRPGSRKPPPRLRFVVIGDTRADSRPKGVNVEVLRRIVAQIGQLKRFLFSVARANSLDDLENGLLSETIREEFKNHDIQLSDDVAITLKEEGKKWQIEDKDETYLVVVNDETLNIYLKRPPKFLIHTGDVTRSGGEPFDRDAGESSPTGEQDEYAEFRKVMKDIGDLPLFVAQGNHDSNIPRFRERLAERGGKAYGNSESLARAKAGKIVSAYRELPGEEGLTFSFTAGRCRFVFLTCYNGTGAQAPQTPTEEAEKFLEEELAAARRASEHAFVVCHPPLHPVAAHFNKDLDGHPEIRDRIAATLNTYRVSAYFCGHEHNYHRKRIDRRLHPEFGKTGFWQMCMGTAGALRVRYPRRAVDVFLCRYTYSVIDVAGGAIRIQTYDPEGRLLDRFLYAVPGRGVRAAGP